MAVITGWGLAWGGGGEQYLKMVEHSISMCRWDPSNRGGEIDSGENYRNEYTVLRVWEEGELMATK